MKRTLLALPLCFSVPITAFAQPTVNGNIINLPDDGWYQVQSAYDYSSVCEGLDTCSVDPGLYHVINLSTEERFENIAVSGARSEEVVDSAISVSGLTISWPDDGWYQVQSSSDFRTVCEAGQSCDVPAGNYVVINHTTGERFNNIQVSETPDVATIVSASPERLREPFHYFALGDSFASGEGNNSNNYDPATDPATDPTGMGNACHRSYDSYAEIINSASPLVQGLEFVACSGAKIDDVAVLGQYGEAAQISVFGSAQNTTAPRFITMSIGGNDAGFVPILQSCATLVDCHLDAATVNTVDLAIASIRPNLEALYRTIMKDPANLNRLTAMAIVGYPRLFGTGSCPVTAPIDMNLLYSADEKTWMDSLAVRLNREIKRAVDTVATEGHRVYFVEVMRTFRGHEACGVLPGPKWINPLDFAEFEHSFHPNELGHSALADQIEGVLRDRVIRFLR